MAYHNKIKNTLMSFLVKKLIISTLPFVIFSTAAETSKQITKFSIEELMNMKIMSVSKKSQRLSEAAAAIYVITRDEILASGLTSIPEVLRLVPGLQVAQINGSNWAISARGFNNRWGNKLLVIQDGRTVYTPMFSGVYWDIQDTIFEDIERIEVIRGPGGTLWGANAVNGVINIITRQSDRTQGGLVKAHLGDQEKGLSLRFGTTIGNMGSVRFFGKAIDRSELTPLAEQKEAFDSWNSQRLGFRSDWQLSPDEQLTVQGEIYKLHADQLEGQLKSIYHLATFESSKNERSGKNILARWQKKISHGASIKLQTYYDHTERINLSTEEHIETVDFDLLYNDASWFDSHDLTTGMNYRHISDMIHGSFTVSFTPKKRATELFSAFIQDEIALTKNLKFIIGSKFEHNDFTGFEYQPSIRFSHNNDADGHLWGAISRAIRIPARANDDIRINVATFSSPFVDPDGPLGPLQAGDPTLISIMGDNTIKSEELTAFELGYRQQLTENFSFDFSSFYNIYDNLITNEKSFAIEGSPAPTHAVIFSTFTNKMDGETYGIEVSSNWAITNNWRLSANYSWLKIDLSADENQSNQSDVEKSNPSHQIQLHTSWNVQNNLDVNLAFYFVDDILVSDVNGPVFIPSYTRMDASLHWQVSNALALKLVGQNLINKNHKEFVTTDVLSTQIPRSVYLQLKQSF